MTLALLAAFQVGARGGCNLSPFKPDRLKLDTWNGDTPWWSDHDIFLVPFVVSLLNREGDESSRPPDVASEKSYDINWVTFIYVVAPSEDKAASPIVIKLSAICLRSPNDHSMASNVWWQEKTNSFKKRPAPSNWQESSETEKRTRICSVPLSGHTTVVVEW